MRAFTFIILFLSVLDLYGQNVSASPGWNANIPSNQITEAGLDYDGTYTSNSNQTSVSATGFGSLSDYFVYVERNVIDWPSGLSIWARRTGNGNSNGFFYYGNISGGESYIQLGNSAQLFYSGSIGWFGSYRSNVPIQYQIRGLSVLLPAKTYSVNVRYTVSD